MLSHQSVGSNPGRDTCVHEQETLLQLLLFTQGYKWVPVRVEVDIVFEKATSPMAVGAAYFPGSWEILQDCYSPNDQDTNLKRIDALL